MADKQELKVQEKREVQERGESTVPARYYMPVTDISEQDDVLTVVMEMPGVEKENIDVQLENDVLSVEGRIDFSNYQNLTPVYTEYNVGHFKRSFTLSRKIDQAKISAEVGDGLLTLVLPKVAEAKPRSIKIN